MPKKRFFIILIHIIFLVLFSLASFSAPAPLPANDGSLSCSNFPADNWDSCYDYPDCYMNGGCTSGESESFSFVYDYECKFNFFSFSRQYRKEQIRECKWAFCEGDTLKYTRNCGIDGACSHSETADCNSYDGIYKYSDCSLATGGGPLGSTSCAPGEEPKIDGNRYDYGCVEKSGSARCEKVSVVKPITCANNPAGCDSSLDCAIGVSVHCAEECDSGEMSGGRCIQRLAPEPIPPPDKCRNGIIDSGEVCDGSNLAGQTCASKGFASGTLKCSKDCKSFDTSSCTSGCNNNNKIEGNEQCDGFDLGRKTCASGNYAGGTLSCNNCILDWTGCVANILVE